MNNNIFFFLLLLLLLVCDGNEDPNLKGMCYGSTTLTNEWGLIYDHIGNGNYTRGIKCQWVIQPLSGVGPITIQFIPTLFAGKIYVWSSTDTTVQPDFTYEGEDSMFMYNFPLDSVDAVRNNFDDFISSNITLETSAIEIKSSVAVVIFAADNLVDSDPQIPSFDTFPGINLVYWTPQGLPDLLCQGYQNITMNGTGEITDGWGIIFQALGTKNRTEQVCSWSLSSPTDDYFLTIKNFQPVSSTYLKITFDGTLDLYLNGTLDFLNSTLHYNYIEDDTSNDTIPFFMWENSILAIPHGHTVEVEYLVPEVEDPLINLKGKINPLTGSSYVRIYDNTKNSGFLIQYWKKEISFVCQSQTQQIDLENVLTIDAYLGVGTVPLKKGDNCPWEIDTLDDLGPWILYFTQLNIGTASRDSISIDIDLDSGPYQLIITADPYEQPPILFIPVQQSSKTVKVSYSVGDGGGRGFQMVFANENEFLKYFNVQSLSQMSQNSTVNASYDPTDISREHDLSVVYNSTKDEFYYLIGMEETGMFDTTITSWFGSTQLYDFINLNRILLYSKRSVALAAYTDLPLSDTNILLIKFCGFGFDLPLLNVDISYFFPDPSQKYTLFNNRRVASLPELTYSLAAINYKSENYIQILYYEGNQTDIIEVKTALDLDIKISNKAIRSIDMCRNETVVISYTETLQNGEIRYNIILFDIDIQKQKAKKAPHALVQNSTVGMNYGQLLSISPSSNWVVTSHSPQLFKVFLMQYRQTNGDPETQFVWWDFWRINRTSSLKQVEVKDTFMVATTCETKITLLPFILCGNEKDCVYQEPDNLEGILNLLTNMNWVNLHPILIPHDTDCASDSQIASTFVQTPSGGKVYVVGYPDTNSVYLIFENTVESDFSPDNFTNGGPRNPPSNYSYLKEEIEGMINNNIKGLMTCIVHTSDNNFGMDVMVSPDLTELFVMGSRVHLFQTKELLLKALNFSAEKTSCFDHQSFESYSFLPGRFAFQGDDWTKFTDSPIMQVAPNIASAIVLINPHPTTRTEFINATRGLLRSPPSQQFTTQPLKVIWKTQVDSAKNLPSIFDFYWSPCPRGSYNDMYGFATCLLCPAGTFQNLTGQLSCIHCGNDTYCPLGAITEMGKVKKEDTSYTTPNFNTYQATGVDTLVWTAIFSTEPEYVIPLYVLWSCLIIGGFLLWLFKEIDPENTSILGTIRITLKNFYYWIDSEAALYWDPVARKFRDKASVRSALLTMAMLLFILLAAIFVVSYFYEYEQYVPGKDVILNNARTSSLKPYFTATSDEKELLKYLRSRPLNFTLSLTGFSRESCITLCSYSKIVSSSGCSVSGSAKFCSDFDDQNPKKVNCTSYSENLCLVEWILPSSIDLLQTSSFTFYLQDVYVQQFSITISMASNDSPNVNIDPPGTAKLIGCTTFDKFQLQNTDLLLFGITRQYMLNYVVQTSEQVTILGSTPGSDYSMEAVIIPLQDSTIDTTTTGESYLGTASPNTMTIEISQPNYFVANTEGRIYQGGQLFLVLVNIITGAIGIFDMFTKLLDKALTTGEDLKERLDACRSNEEVELSPRATTFDFNPYMKEDLTSFLLEAIRSDDKVKSAIKAALQGSKEISAMEE